MNTFLVSRTDAIGDLVLTLPVCGWLKQRYPGCRVVLLGRDYTRAVAAACPAIDEFISDDDLQQLPVAEQVAALRAVGAEAVLHVFPSRRLARLCRQARIPLRIGTRNRWFHWLTCNRLVPLSRRNSPLHEAQLNMELLRPLGLTAVPSLAELVPLGRLVAATPLTPAHAGLLTRERPGQLNIILHPRSRGHGREWGLEHYGALARALYQRGHRVFVSGTQAEGDSMREWLHAHAPILTDLTGQLSLPQFMAFIAAADGLVASGTGPLHLAAALGRHALGVFPPMRPIHPGRWAPLGPHAGYVVLDRPDCQDCRQAPTACTCIKAIAAAELLSRIDTWQPLAAL
ncbi:glycosyltransferase family 9 protein [Hymenobacter edaphi]|uniref:Glycosyl transferase family 9 n=1 Tax=Hymenobacter edaphi TaxID=2211146 RepID=A0A328BIG2_9BACT|nr:glycosyltransferase family 9 protein [Hymenobacter edaphi]RAK66737.1 glycosyl transferase family 9 [Hymenobacter edaphi]